MASQENPIPLIDFSESAGLPLEELAVQVKAAVKSVGFLHVRGLGVSQEEARSMFQLSSEIFASPVEELNTCPVDADGNGYKAVGTTQLAEKKKAGMGDYKENFTFGRFHPPATEAHQPLPSCVRARKAEADAFHRKLNDATNRLLDVFSVALNLPIHYFRDRHAAGNNGLSFINYPPIPPSETATAAPGVRAGEHKDWGSLTLLFQEEGGTPGLEVFLPDARIEAAKTGAPYQLIGDADLTKGTWYSAPIIPDTILVNVGLALEAWTGGQTLATLHRVVFPQNGAEGFKGRKSIAYFVQPSSDVVFNPILPSGEIVQTEGAMTSGEFYAERVRASTVAAY